VKDFKDGFSLIENFPRTETERKRKAFEHVRVCQLSNVTCEETMRACSETFLFRYVPVGFFFSFY